MTTISAMIVADSVGHHAPRLTTMLLRYPLVIHAELMTHRVFSRNAASSRAIPWDKLVKATLDDPYVPLFWTKNEPGMQGYTELDGVMLSTAKQVWMDALTSAVRHGRRLYMTGAHKQIVNRLLAPFAHITVVVSSTNWSNWFALRDHEKAEPHIRLLAQRMRGAMEASNPEVLLPGHWHLPFVGAKDRVAAREEAYTGLNVSHVGSMDQIVMNKLVRLSAARCASTSYKTVEEFDMTFARADMIHEKLVGEQPIHASPTEHQAQVDRYERVGLKFSFHSPELSGNFEPGWIQYRKTLVGECQ